MYGLQREGGGKGTGGENEDDWGPVAKGAEGEGRVEGEKNVQWQVSQRGLQKRKGQSERDKRLPMRFGQAQTIDKGTMHKECQGEGEIDRGVLNTKQN